MFVLLVDKSFFRQAQNLTPTADGRVLTGAWKAMSSLQTMKVLECKGLKYYAVIAKVTWAICLMMDQKKQRGKDFASTQFH